VAGLCVANRSYFLFVLSSIRNVSQCAVKIYFPTLTSEILVLLSTHKNTNDLRRVSAQFGGGGGGGKEGGFLGWGVCLGGGVKCVFSFLLGVGGA